MRCQPGPAVLGRDFQIINLSMPRTGTSSFAGVFENYHSTHEFMMSRTILMLLDYKEGRITASALRHFLRDRRERARHAVDSAAFFYLEPELVIDTFPGDKFFFAVRSCESWIISQVDHATFVHKSISEGKVSGDMSFLNRYGKLFMRGYTKELFLDTARLKKERSMVIADLAQFWKIYTIRTLAAMLKLDARKRLVLRLEDFDNSLSRIAAFAEIPVDSLALRRKHLNRDSNPVYFRSLLGPELLKTACTPGQQAVDQYLNQNFSP